MIKFGAKFFNSQSEKRIQTIFNQSEEKNNNKYVDTVRHIFVGDVDAPAGGCYCGGGADTS